jgi:hypothetical protein
MEVEATEIAAWVERHRDTVRAIVLGSNFDAATLAEDPYMLGDNLFDLDLILCAFDSIGLDKSELMDAACAAVKGQPEATKFKRTAALFVGWNGADLGACPVYATITKLP